MSDSGWVTDPDLVYTLVALRALLPGDEIKLQRADDYSIPTELNGSVLILGEDDGVVWNTKMYPHLRLDDNDNDTLYRPVTPVAKTTNGWYVALDNIAAWRRPTCQKKD